MNGEPIYIFHHIPKTAGSSLLLCLQKWFEVLYDYREFWSKPFPPKKNLNEIHAGQCLAGHYEAEGVRLKQRYPGIFRNRNFRVFTVVRDPLQLRISLFYYEKKYGLTRESETLEQALLSSNHNYMAHILDCTSRNFRAVLDRYYFVGVSEELQRCLNTFAKAIGKPQFVIPRRNATSRDEQVSHLSGNVLSEFRSLNYLDYEIYSYGINRYRDFSLSGNDS
jgi:hypothetical protein